MKCQAIKKNGFPCGANIRDGEFCHIHLRSRAREEAKKKENPVVTVETEAVDDIKKKVKALKKPKADTEIDIRKRAKERREKRKAESVRLGRLPGQKLIAPKRPGYHRHFANDVGTRLDDLQDKGYTFVTESVEGDAEIRSTDIGTRKSLVVDQQKGGGEITAYLMEIPDEWFREDQQEKEKRIRAREEQIYRVADDGKGIGQSSSNVYDPLKGRGAYNPGR